MVHYSFDCNVTNERVQRRRMSELLQESYCPLNIVLLLTRVFDNDLTILPTFVLLVKVFCVVFVAQQEYHPRFCTRQAIPSISTLLGLLPLDLENVLVKVYVLDPLTA